jgi:methionyl-tRNA formyltransferase
MRGFTPWPGAYTTFRERTCLILGEPVSNPVSDDEQRAGAQESERTPTNQRSANQPSPPGTIRLSSDGLFVSCAGATELRVLSVKREGGKKVDAMEFAAGARLTEGERFGNT